MYARISGTSLFMVICWASLAAVAQEQPNDEEKKTLALQWLDKFAVDQVLFHSEDVEALREKVAAMSPEEAAAWWKESQEERELLDSAEWKKTRQWLKEFLRVQAIYSDEQIRKFQSEAFAKAEESPRSLKEVMDEITAKRRELATGAKQSAAMRKQLLAVNEAYRHEQVRFREAAALQRAATPPTATTTTTTTPDLSRFDRGTYDQPLVRSLDVARWTLLRQFFPRW